MFILVIVSYVIVMLLETVTLLKGKKSKKIIFYFSLMIFSLIISVLLTLGVQLPSPSNQIKNIIITILGQNN